MIESSNLDSLVRHPGPRFDDGSLLHSSSLRARRLGWRSTVVALALSMLAGCGGPATEDDADADVAVYDMRAIVRQLPDASRPGSEFLVHHEPVPTFVDSEGNEVGMDSMVMGFPLADRSMLDGIEIGDRVELRLEVAWEGSPPIAITRLEELPDGTRLSFESATEDAAAPNAPNAGHDHGQTEHAGHGDPGGQGDDGDDGHGAHGSTSLAPSEEPAGDHAHGPADGAP
ncbi:MAG: copper-binding protein [Acidobacteriota bacterium]